VINEVLDWGFMKFCVTMTHFSASVPTIPIEPIELSAKDSLALGTPSSLGY